ncbi:glycosyltransferase [Legionella cardiaca]|uniref:Glycosyltransferase n=1 Tax=Legionella cardiaca TaxID=1071983 RepID=A0ABY8AS70_9GAMM|nr:glycosyltransferase [Legionella cardiaca]WED42141.1 glycosyltransferase [Legionella cardiaca]
MTEKLTILISADTYPPDINGAARFGGRLAEGLLKLGHKVHVIAPRSSPGESFTGNKNGIIEHRLRSHAIPTHLSFRMCFPWQIKNEIRKIFDKVKPDVVHVQCHFMIGRYVINEAIRRRIPIVATNHVMPENVTPYVPLPNIFIKLLVKYLWHDAYKVLKKVTIITTPTDLATETFTKKLKLPGIVTVSNGINSSIYELKPDECIEKPAYPIVLFVGRLAKEKHIDELIKAIAKTKPSLNVHAEIVGEGEILEKLKKLAASLNVSGRIHFLGAISDEKLRKVYLRATLFCMPGTAELQSLATLEAMSASLPVILADALALPHLVIEGKNGYLFQPGNTNELAKKINKILVLPEDERLKMGREGHAMAKKHDIQKTLSTFELLYVKGLNTKASES